MFIQHKMPVIYHINLLSFLAEYKLDDYVYTCTHKHACIYFWWTVCMSVSVTVCFLWPNIVLVVIKEGIWDGEMSQY